MTYAISRSLTLPEQSNLYLRYPGFEGVGRRNTAQISAGQTPHPVTGQYTLQMQTPVKISGKRCLTTARRRAYIVLVSQRQGGSE